MPYFTNLGCIHLLNTRKYCDNARKYCGNTLTNIEPVLEKCVHLQVQYSQVLSQYL